MALLPKGKLCLKLVSSCELDDLEVLLPFAALIADAVPLVFAQGLNG